MKKTTTSKIAKGKAIHGSLTFLGYEITQNVCEMMKRIAELNEFDLKEMRQAMLDIDEVNSQVDKSTWNWQSGLRRDSKLEPAPVWKYEGRAFKDIAKQYT